MTRGSLRTAWIALLGSGLLLVASCASFDPQPKDSVRFKERAQTQERSGLRVSTAVLGRDEAKRVFGVDLAKKLIQPVWLEIENTSDRPYSLLFTGTDPLYFSAHEAAYTSHFFMRPWTNKKIDIHFSDYEMSADILPHSRRSGFVFTNLQLGTKEVRVRLFSPGRTDEFVFYAAVPGFRADYHEVDWEALAAQEFTDHEDEDAFAQVLRELPCCTTRKDGSGRGDPLNLIIIGSADEVGQALIRSGWDETETLSWGSAWRTFRAFFGGTYKYSPMSALYVFGRSQDAGYQKARDTIHQRNHLRLWLSPLKFRGEHVWVGTITRDIGVYFTRRSWSLTTHAIDPYVDEARTYIAEDFGNAQAIDRAGFVSGVGAATREQPHRNLMNARWWTDGLRVVIEVPEKPTPREEMRFFYWEWSGATPEQSEEINRWLRTLKRQP
jgi:hypothetical protein